MKNLPTKMTCTRVRPRTELPLARLPPLMLDWLGPDYATKEELLLKGYDLPCYPSILAA